MLEKHPDFTYRVEFVGKELQPVLIIDNFLKRPELLIDNCCQTGGFNDADSLYPGVRKPAPDIYMQALYDYIRPIIAKEFGLIDQQIRRIDSSYSLVVTPVSQLTPIQAMPHVDSLNMKELASVYFLCGTEKGGTSLYRHKKTGFEYINAARTQIFSESMNESTKNRIIAKQYMNGSNEFFEQIANYQSNFNRLIMYRCTSLHSGNIASDFDFNPDPRKGRLTLNTFIGSYE
jgi:Family of unknown function (DUF6445)